jgi:hypothetical protein
MLTFPNRLRLAAAVPRQFFSIADLWHRFYVFPLKTFNHGSHQREAIGDSRTTTTTPYVCPEPGGPISHHTLAHRTCQIFSDRQLEIKVHPLSPQDLAERRALNHR